MEFWHVSCPKKCGRSISLYHGTCVPLILSLGLEYVKGCHHQWSNTALGGESFAKYCSNKKNQYAVLLRQIFRWTSVDMMSDGQTLSLCSEVAQLRKLRLDAVGNRRERSRRWIERLLLHYCWYLFVFVFRAAFLSLFVDIVDIAAATTFFFIGIVKHYSQKEGKFDKRNPYEFEVLLPIWSRSCITIRRPKFLFRTSRLSYPSGWQQQPQHYIKLYSLLLSGYTRNIQRHFGILTHSFEMSRAR